MLPKAQSAPRVSLWRCTVEHASRTGAGRVVGTVACSGSPASGCACTQARAGQEWALDAADDPRGPLFPWAGPAMHLHRRTCLHHHVVHVEPRTGVGRGAVAAAPCVLWRGPFSPPPSCQPDVTVGLWASTARVLTPMLLPLAGAFPACVSTGKAETTVPLVPSAPMSTARASASSGAGGGPGSALSVGGRPGVWGAGGRRH